MTLSPDRIGAWFERALDLSAQRQRHLTANINNVDTPGYTPSDLEFRDYLRQAIEAPDQLDGLGGPLVERRTDVEPDLDGNRVDLDREVVHMASNRLFYEFAAEVTGRRLSLMRYAIDEGGR